MKITVHIKRNGEFLEFSVGCFKFQTYYAEDKLSGLALLNTIISEVSSFVEKNPKHIHKILSTKRVFDKTDYHSVDIDFPENIVKNNNAGKWCLRLLFVAAVLSSEATNYLIGANMSNHVLRWVIWGAGISTDAIGAILLYFFSGFEDALIQNIKRLFNCSKAINFENENCNITEDLAADEQFSKLNMINAIIKTISVGLFATDFASNILISLGDISVIAQNQSVFMYHLALVGATSFQVMECGVYLSMAGKITDVCTRFIKNRFLDRSKSDPSRSSNCCSFFKSTEEPVCDESKKRLLQPDV
jgi:hypothetical protein